MLDCPTDGSDAVAREYSEGDSRFVIIENATNLHIGESRNRGIAVARGEYIGFCDHDDWCEPEMYEHLYDKARADDADVCMSHLLYQYPQRAVLYPAPTENYSLDEALRFSVALRPLQAGVPTFANIHSVWLGVYRRSFLIEHSIRFVDTRTHSAEDILFIADCYLNRPRLTILPEVVYHWNQNPRSTLNTDGYISPDKIVNTIVYLNDSVRRSGYSLDSLPEAGEFTVRRLYTSFRYELQRHHALAPLRTAIMSSPSLCRYLLEIDGADKVRHLLPITKWLLYLFMLRPTARRGISSLDVNSCDEA